MGAPETNLDRLRSKLGLPAASIGGDEWAESQATFPARAVPFLREAFVNEVCDFLRISGAVRSVLLRALSMFRANPELRRLAWHFHQLVCQGKDPARARTALYPTIPSHVHELAGMFYAIVCLSCVPHVRARHRRRHIAESITRDTLADLELWIRAHHARHGTWGFSNMNWLASHLTGRVYQLGRLQFCFDAFAHDFHGYRHRRTGRVLLLAGNGMRFRDDGQFADADGVHARDSWTSAFHKTANLVRGNVIHPGGFACRPPRSLRRSEWQEVLRKGDPTLSVHIPARGPIDHAVCGASFQQAATFFSEHFPDRPYRAFTCESWLLDPQFDTQLPAHSNIRRFLREWYLYPMPGANDHQTWERIFGRKYADLGEAPQDTSLQKVIVRHAKRGGHWRYGGGFILASDLNWGGCVYRRTRTREARSK